MSRYNISDLSNFSMKRPEVDITESGMNRDHKLAWKTTY